MPLVHFHLEPAFGREHLTVVFCYGIFAPSIPILTWPGCFAVIILGWLQHGASQPLNAMLEITGLGLNGRIKALGDEWGGSSCSRRWPGSAPYQSKRERAEKQLLPRLSPAFSTSFISQGSLNAGLRFVKVVLRGQEVFKSACSGKCLEWCTCWPKR